MTAKHLWVLTAVAFIGVLGSFAWQAQEMGWLRLARVSNLPPSILQPLGDARTAAPDLAAIRALAPFGRQVQPDRQIASPATTRPAQLDVTLRGVLAHDDRTRARAFLSDGSSTTAFRIGEDVKEGVVLVEVLASSVMLEIDGARVELGFEGLADPDPTATAADTPAPEAESDPFARLAAAVLPGRGSLDLREAPPPETVDGYIDMWRGRLQRDPAEVMDTIGVERTGRGYRIKPDPDIGVTLAGLQPGDIVTRLNGQEVGDIDKDRKLYDQVATAGVARLEVERSGQTLLMTFSLR